MNTEVNRDYAYSFSNRRRRRRRRRMIIIMKIIITITILLLLIIIIIAHDPCDTDAHTNKEEFLRHIFLGSRRGEKKSI